uniref:Uncharacterized protein n=1 Tax=Corvus moneduloides TaxID=1196302 RepID=A0A8C3D852_CORMO
MLAVPDMAAPSAGLRQRRPGRDRAPAGAPGAAPAASPDSPEPGVGAAASPLSPGTFWLTRIVLLRSIALLYFVAFLVAFHQNKQLIGEKGLLPCKLYLQDVKKYFKGKVGLDALSYAPTLIWFLDWSDMDSTLDCLALAGLAVAAFVLLTGCANMVLMSLLWLLYLSLVNVGQIWWVLNPSYFAFPSCCLWSTLIFVFCLEHWKVPFPPCLVPSHSPALLEPL